MSDTGRYGAPENVGGLEAKTADALVGEPLGASTADAMLGAAAWGVYSTAPYKPPKTIQDSIKEQEKSASPLCAVEDCRSYATKETAYCIGHLQKLGLADEAKRCSHEGCKGFKQKGREFCRWHVE